MNVIPIITRLYAPVLAAVLLIIVVLKQKRKPTQNQDGNAKAKVRISLLGMVSTEVPIMVASVAKLIQIVVISAVLILYYLLFVDFTRFYPTEMNMTVAFDSTGIKELIDDIGLTEFDGQSIVFGNDEYDSVFNLYLTNVDTFIHYYTGYEGFFKEALGNSSNIYENTGKTTFHVKKLAGYHKYKIGDSFGEITHILHIPGENPVQVKQEFTKIRSQYDYIDLNIAKALFGKRIILAPEYTQSLFIDIFERKMSHEIFALTLLRAMPYPNFGNSVYLYKQGNKLYPIGYVIYSAESP